MYGKSDMGCSAPLCKATYVGAKLVHHMKECRNLSPLQCEICEIMFSNAMAKCRHKNKFECVPPAEPTPLWYPLQKSEALHSVTTRKSNAGIDMVLSHGRTSSLFLAEMTPIFGDDGRFLTYMRNKDGFVNATEMCTKTETKVRMALRIKDFKAHTNGIGCMAAKAEAMNISKDELSEDCKDLANKTQTWIHPCLVADLVTWCGLRVNIDAVNTLAPFIDQTSKCVFLQAIYNEAGELITDMRMSDGFINAIKMCKSTSFDVNGQLIKFTRWEKQHRTDLIKLSKILKAEEDDHDTTATEYDNVLEVVPAGKYSGSWIHPHMALQLAQWCKIKFDVQAKHLMNRHLPEDMQIDVSVRKSEPTPAVDSSRTAFAAELNLDANYLGIESTDLLSDPKTLKPDFTSEVKFLQSLTGDDGQMVTEMRTSDGFINATKMCSSACTKNGERKVFRNWEVTNRRFQFELTKDLIQEGLLDKSHLRSNASETFDPDNKYPHLVEIINGGAYRGSWVHPRVAINLATWCSVKFDVQTNGLISRYTKGEVTTEESQAVASAIESNINDQLIESHPLPIGYPDVKRRDAIDMTLGIPTHALPPNVSYVLRLGDLSDGDTLDKYGRTTSFAVRMGSHSREHPGCQILMIVTTGTHDAKPIEDTLRSFFNNKKIDVEKPNGRILTECFKSMSDIEYIDKARELLLRTHSNIIETIHFNGEVYDYRPAYDKDALAIEQEKTKQSEELTKQLTLRLELAKLGILT